MSCFTRKCFRSIRRFESLRKALLVLPVVFFALASPVFADSINYTVTGTLADTGLQFWFTFALPSTVSSLDTFTTSTFVDTGDEFDSNLPTEVTFFSAKQGGLLTIKVSCCFFQGEVFEFFGPQIYAGTSSPFTLLTGQFPIAGGQFISGFPSALSAGSVTASRTAATPEPATLLLLGSGLLAIGVFCRKIA